MAAAVLLVLAGLATVAGAIYVAGFLREYGDTNASGAVQGVREAVLPAGLVLVLAGVAFVARRSPRVLFAGVALVLLTVAGSALAGNWAVNARYASFADSPDCSLGAGADSKGRAVDAALQAQLRQVQAVFDQVNHPAPFTGTLEVGPKGCLAGLATKDLAAALSFYRVELPAEAWTVGEDSGQRLVATWEDMVMPVEAGRDGVAAQVRVAVASAS
jgi:hypothetical protein